VCDQCPILCLFILLLVDVSPSTVDNESNSHSGVPGSIPGRRIEILFNDVSV